MPLKIFVDICFLRAAPQDLPVSRSIMLGALVVYATAGMLGVLDVLTLESAILAATVDTLLLAAVTHLVLQWRRLENRLTQTLTALAGCGALLSLMAWSATGLVRELFQPEWVWAVFLPWYTLVFGHIVRHALSISLAAGVAASLLYLVLSISITGFFMNPAATATS